MSIKNKIKKLSFNKSEEEICGFVIHDGKKYDAIKCENKSLNKDLSFLIPAKVFLSIKNKYRIVAVFHSHIDTDENPSEFDIVMSDSVCYPFVTFSTKTKKFSKYIPKYTETEESEIDKIIQ